MKSHDQKRTEEKQIAALWLYIASKGLLKDFTEFYKQRKDKSLAELDKELRDLTRNNNNQN